MSPTLQDHPLHHPPSLASLKSSRVLIIDDEPTQRLMLRLHLERAGCVVDEAGDVESARNLLGLSREPIEPREPLSHGEGAPHRDHAERSTPRGFDLVLCDWRLQSAPSQSPTHEDGLTLIQEIKSGHQRVTHERAEANTPGVLFMSAHATHDVALRAIELGASDFIAKPFEVSELIFRLQKLTAERALRQRLDTLEAEVTRSADPLEELVGRSPQMMRLARVVRRVAPRLNRALIQGESGTGKELVARALHRLSAPTEEARGPFIAVNCAALSEGLIESELFGHARGAFTGAQAPRRGLIESAHDGVLFLDEVGELPMSTQAKLLRVLQESELRPVGSSRTIPVRFKLIAATLKDLEREVTEGRFREDLYYRLNVITLKVPPLRERDHDIELLTDHLIQKLCGRLQRDLATASPDVMTTLQSYQWPGNVRELENALEHALVLSDAQTIRLPDLPSALTERAEELGFTLDPSELNSLNSLNSHGEGRARGESAHLQSAPPLPLIYHALSPYLAYSQSVGLDVDASVDASVDAGVEAGVDSLSIKRLSRALEELLIREALRRSGGVKTQAARALEISTKTLLYKMRDYKILGADEEGQDQAGGGGDEEA